MLCRGARAENGMMWNEGCILLAGLKLLTLTYLWAFIVIMAHFIKTKRCMLHEAPTFNGVASCHSSRRFGTQIVDSCLQLYFHGLGLSWVSRDPVILVKWHRPLSLRLSLAQGSSLSPATAGRQKHIFNLELLARPVSLNITIPSWKLCAVGPTSARASHNYSCLLEFGVDFSRENWHTRCW